jgi:hypothetical protein
MFATTSHQSMRTARRSREGWVRAERPSRQSQLFRAIAEQTGNRR